MRKNFLKRTLSFVILYLITSSICFADKNQVIITYVGNKVEVSNFISSVKVKHEGAKVTVESNVEDREIVYVLKGKTDDGCFDFIGNYKATIVLQGLSLKNKMGAALNLKCGKRMKLEIAHETSNYLEDGADTLHKACIYTKGHLELKGDGHLVLKGNGKNVIAAKEYIKIGESTGKIDITSATANGISSGAELTVNGGQIHINLTSVDKKALKSDSTMTINGGTIIANLKGDGGKGIKCNTDLIINDGHVSITTSGNYVSERAFGGMGGFPGFGFGEMGDSIQFGGFPGGPDFGGMGGFPGFGFGFGEMGDSIQFGGFPGGPDFGGMGGFPGFGFGEMGDSIQFGGFPDGPDFGGMGGFPGFGFGGIGGNTIEISDSIRFVLFGDTQEERGRGFSKRKYNGSAKAVKVVGRIMIHGGEITLVTASAGAEGLEGKKGVTITGGNLTITAQDDGISSGGPISISGGRVFVWSMGNDAIDSNYPRQGAIQISGGWVMACSQVGPPEEAFDCDFNPIIITGGTVFGMGGSMGGGATVPAQNKDTQYTVSLNGLPCPKGKQLVCLDQSGKTLYAVEFPFTMQSSNSLLSLPQFRKDETYTIKILEPSVVLKEFTFDDVIAK